MKEIIEKYREWSEGMDDDHIHDEIQEFFNSLDRSDLLWIVESLINLTEIRQD